MSKQEHSVITFLKKHGKEIMERERKKYEPIKNEKVEQIDKKDELEELKKENFKLKSKTNTEWLNKYKFYKNKYKIQKKELRETKSEVMKVLENVENLKNEISQLKIEVSRLKGKEKIEFQDSSNETDKEQIDSSNTEEEEIRYLEESDNKEQEIIIKENQEILEALGKMKNINAIIEDESDIEQEENSIRQTDNDMETETYTNKNAEDYPEEELGEHIITRRNNIGTDHIPLGQREQVQDFVGSITQGININGYFLDLDNVYDEQEITRRIKDWNLGMYIALMNAKNLDNIDYIYDLISKTIIGKAAFWIESINHALKEEAKENAKTWSDMLNMFDVVLKREFLGEQWFVAQDQVMVERKIEIVMYLNNMKCCKITKLPEYTISFSKLFYEAKFLPDETIVYQQLYYDHLPSPYNTEITKEYNNLEPKENTLGERIRVLRLYLMRKCEEYRVQQKIKKDKKYGLREICGFTERKLVFGCDNKLNNTKNRYRKYKKSSYNKDEYYKKQNKPYRPYKTFKYKRRRFRRYKNTPENRKRFKYKRKFRKRRYTKPLQGNNKTKITDCKCWNCNEKGHYANKCPKLKQNGVKYIDSTDFIMKLEYIKEDNNNDWYNDEMFYISETEPEEINYIEENNTSSDELFETE